MGDELKRIQKLLSFTINGSDSNNASFKVFFHAAQFVSVRGSGWWGEVDTGYGEKGVVLCFEVNTIPYHWNQ
jgi:hypothetical protein